MIIVVLTSMSHENIRASPLIGVSSKSGFW